MTKYELVSSLQHFHKFVRREPQHLRVAISQEELDKMSIVLAGCLTSLQKHRLMEDAAKRIQSIGVLGRFLCNETFEDARRELDECERYVDRRTTGVFCMIRNVLTSRGTGDLCNMTLEEFDSHYELHGALQLTSRACKLFREHLCSDKGTQCTYVRLVVLRL